MNISGFNITISLATALVALALMPVANARAGDFIYGDDFDAGPSCTGVVSPGIAALASQQRAVRPPSRLNSGGASVRQRSNAAGQRAANAQPGGRRERSGGWPSIAVRR